ncbi:hypothetical protein NW762_004599 [Fusarium torreyae]|uniref:VWFA domain-containing protein n=1 Tax=Fusarium torreyae TaxID=1237075 RepID=A0A9W8S4I5_9HYPO|nr:hypothetical protein NW762_004599 [Fusarium torreyae]
MSTDGQQNGHHLLIQLANRRGRSHITKYIQTKLKEHEARIIHNYLMRNTYMIEQFANAIPSSFSATVGINAAETVGDVAGDFGFGFINMMIDKRTDDSDAMKMARKILTDWLNAFQSFKPRKIESVISLLEQIDGHMNYDSHGRTEDGQNTLLDSLRHHMYGGTPIKQSLQKAMEVFRSCSAQQQVLVLVSDGYSTDGDPLPLGRELKDKNITIATVFLTDSTSAAEKSLYDEHEAGWDKGRRTLFDMATRVHGSAHPIPVMASMGWSIPSSGECGLYTTVCSTDALEEFCSLLLSARFGTADAFLDILGKLDLDSYVNDKHIQTRNNPSDQGSEGVCYAHATAAVTHMALLRIVDREGGCPSIQTIRNRILATFPADELGHPTAKVMEQVVEWYRPLRFRAVDKDGARQAVLRRRPILTTFRLSDSGWDAFVRHFDRDAETSTIGVLKSTTMQPHRRGGDGGGHAVVMTRCDPHSLTFLNSWGNHWGNNGSFSVENAGVLGLEPLGQDNVSPRFYDIYWLEGDLTPAERAACAGKVDSAVQSHAQQHPTIFSLEATCPHCHLASPLASFRGSIRCAVCPQCRKSFAPQPGHLIQALYARAGFGEVV